MTTERRWWKDGATGRLRDEAPLESDRDWMWVDVEGADDEALRRLASEFDLDELALEDALDPDLFPRYEDYGHFVVAAVRGLTTTQGAVRTTPLLCLAGERFLVTLHHEPLPGVEFLVETAMTHVRTAEGGPDRMLARLTDVGSRRFDPVVLEIDSLLQECEASAAAGSTGALAPLQAIQRQVAELRSVIRPQRSAIQSLVYSDTDLIGERARRRLTDVLERHARLEESLDAARGIANTVVEIHRGVIAERTNEIMKVLTVFSATLLPMSVIAGIYGMNFSNMPELDFRLGYPFALTAMAVVGVLMWRYFVRRGFVGRAEVSHTPAQAAARLTRAATLPVRTVGSLIADGLRVRRGPDN